MKRGYELTTIDDIAAEIGSSKGLIYYSFRSKADIFFATYETAMNMAIERAVPITQESGTAARRLRKLCEAHVFAMMQSMEYHVVTRIGLDLHMPRAMTDEQLIALRVLFNLRDRYELLYRGLIQEGIADGSLRQQPASIAARTLLGAINSVEHWFKQREGQSTREQHGLAEQIVEVVMGGLLKEKTPVERGA